LKEMSSKQQSLFQFFRPAYEQSNNEGSPLQKVRDYVDEFLKQWFV